eukprot:Em0081g18a
MVRGDLVPGERLLEGRCAVVRCAHGDTVVYPMAQICLEVDGHKINTAAAVSNTLPMAVLLGTDVPELLTLLNCRTLRGKVETSEAFATTRAASRRRVEEEREQARREKSSGVQPKPVLAEQPKESWDLGAELDEAIFQGGRQRPTQTRSQKRQKRQEHSRRKLQETDPTLSALRKVSGREVDSGGGGSDVSVVVKNGLMYRVVIELAHSIPLAGHMGRNKTIGRILQRFYWPTVYKDVAEFCKRLFPEAVPMRSIDAENVAEELLKLFARVGIPVEILTDQGANFTSQLLSELYSMLHIMGFSSTGFSPFELLYGREVRGPLDVVKETWEASERSNQSVVSYVVNIREKLEKMMALVRGERGKKLKRYRRPDNHQQVVGWAEDMETDLQEEIPVWKDGEAVTLDSCHMGEQLTPEQKTELCTLLKEVSGVMSNIPGVTRMAEHCIETGNARPVKLPPYRIPQAYKKQYSLEVKEMLEAGIIEPSTRRLNAVSESDAYPMPRVDDLIDRLGGMTSIRLPLQHPVVVPVHPNAIWIEGSTSHVSEVGDRVLQGLEEFSGAYIDDIIVFSKVWTDHVRHLQAVLGRLQLARLTVKTSKCHFGVTACSYLGFVTDASNRGIGAVLSQCDEEGQEHPVAYYSRKLLPREERYSTVEKECLAIKEAIHHFRTYLLGRQFKGGDGSSALVWMDRLKDTNARLTRWSLLLQSYDSWWSIAKA